MGMDRKIISKHRMSELPDYEFVPGAPAERLAMVWPLTAQVYSLSHPEFDPKQKMQRHVTRLIRPKK